MQVEIISTQDILHWLHQHRGCEMTNGNIYTCVINSSTWYANATTKTVEAFVKHIVDELNEIGVGVEYAEVPINTGYVYPNVYCCVKFPWIDGTLHDDIYPVLYFDTYPANNSLNAKYFVRYALVNRSTKQMHYFDGGYAYSHGTGSGNASTHGQNNYALDAGLNITVATTRLNDCGFYTVGWVNAYGAGNNGVSMIVTTMKNINDNNSYNAVISRNCYNTGDATLYLGTATADYNFNNGTKTFTQQSSGHFVQIDMLTFGEYYNENFYMTYPSKFKWVGSLIGVNELDVYRDGWSHNGIVLGGVKFSPAIGYSNSDCCVCIKEPEEE